MIAADVMTSGATQPRRTGRSALALFSGLFFIFAASTAVDVVMHATHVFPPWGQPMSDALFVLALGYRLVIQVAGCYLTARLAPTGPMRHALWLGTLGVVLSALAAAATWNRPEMGAHWYPLLLVASSLPCAWLGGALFERRARA